MAVAELDLPERLVNALDEAGIIYVSQLLRMTPGQFFAVPNVGPGSLSKVYEALAGHGFKRRTAEDAARLYNIAEQARKQKKAGSV